MIKILIVVRGGVAVEEDLQQTRNGAVNKRRGPLVGLAGLVTKPPYQLESHTAYVIIQSTKAANRGLRLMKHDCVK